jgi:uncharacterized membrane protein
MTQLRRAIGIDLLRLIAALQMISGHTVDALIAPEHRVGAAWATYTSIRGLTAVAFLFAAGASFAMVARGSPNRRRARVGRTVELIVISYVLHPPVALFSSDDAARLASLRELFAVDVLACIGVSLLALELLARVPARWFALASAIVSLVFLLGAPLVEPIDPSGAAAPLLDYFTKRGGSLFPLFPFAGFAFAGAAISELARPREDRARSAKVFAAFAIAVGVAAAAWNAASSAPPPDAFYAWPAASFARLAIVASLTCALTLATLRVEQLPEWATKLAGETLFLYVSHLLALYVAGIGLVHWIGASLSVEAAAAAAVTMVIACCAAALGWNRWRAIRQGH